MAFVEERACFLHLGLGGAPFRFEFRIIRVLGDYGAERWHILLDSGEVGPASDEQRAAGWEVGLARVGIEDVLEVIKEEEEAF